MADSPATSGFAAAVAIAAPPSSDARKNSRRAGVAGSGRFGSTLSVQLLSVGFEDFSPSFSGSRFMGLPSGCDLGNRVCADEIVSQVQAKVRILQELSNRRGAHAIEGNYSGRIKAGSNQVRRRGPKNRLSHSLRFHLLLQQARRFLFQTNVQRPVTNQVAMPTRASKRLKQHILWSLRLSSRNLGLSRLFGPQASQRIERRLQLITGEMNRQKRQHQMKTVRIAAKQNEIVIVAERRKPRLARVWQVPSPSKGSALRTSALLQTACSND